MQPDHPFNTSNSLQISKMIFTIFSINEMIFSILINMFFLFWNDSSA